MNKLISTLSIVIVPLLFVSQEVLWYDNFESYSNGYDVISNTSGLQGWSSTGTTVVDNGNGAGSSNSYYQSPSGGSTIQYVITPAGTGYTYAMYADINVSDWIHGGISIQIVSLNGAGNGDNVTVTDVSFNNYGGSNSLNSWKEVTASYTTDGSETGDLAFRIKKTWGSVGEKIDDWRVVCTSCPKKSYTDGNWSSVSTWGGEVVPTSSQNITISHDVTVDASTNTLGTVTVDASKTLTIND